MKKGTQIQALAFLIVAGPSLLWAHETASRAEAMRWSWEPFVVFPILASTALYGIGRWRMRTRLRPLSSIWSLISFLAGIFALVIALDSPVHLLGGQLFWVHMTQHELLMLVVAPLLIVGRPLVPFLWSLPLSWRGSLGQLSKSRIWQRVWIAISSPAAAWIIHAAALWAWHAPRLFEAALHREAIHAAQHLCFLGSALLFWWTLIHGRH